MVELENVKAFTDELFEFMKSKGCFYHFELNHPIPFVNALNYIAIMLYPPDLMGGTKREEDRLRFVGNMLWLFYKDREVNGEVRDFLKVEIEKYPFGFTFKNANTNFRKASSLITKRFHAWQIWAHAFHNGTSIRNASKLFLQSQAQNDYSKKYRLEHDLEDSLVRVRKEKITPYRHILHIIGGCFEEIIFHPEKERNIKQMMYNPFWVTEAIDKSNDYLKSIILDDYLNRQAQTKSGIQWKNEFKKFVIVS